MLKKELKKKKFNMTRIIGKCIIEVPYPTENILWRDNIINGIQLRRSVVIVIVTVVATLVAVWGFDGFAPEEKRSANLVLQADLHR